MPLSGRVLVYVIDHDLGFAPNPFHGICSLAACKPMIRSSAQVGDVVVGLGSKKNGLQGRMIYWMRVTEITRFDHYWSDVRFRHKQPVMRGSLLKRYGDNIYRADGAGGFIQVDSFHSEPDGVPSAGDIKTDTGRTDKVLLGNEFAYFGRLAPEIPPELREFIWRGQGHKRRFSDRGRAEFLQWLLDREDRGVVGMPSNWPI